MASHLGIQKFVCFQTFRLPSVPKKISVPKFFIVPAKILFFLFAFKVLQKKLTLQYFAVVLMRIAYYSMCHCFYKLLYTSLIFAGHVPRVHLSLLFRHTATESTGFLGLMQQKADALVGLCSMRHRKAEMNDSVIVEGGHV